MKRFYRLLCVLSVAGAVVATACSESGDDMPKEVEFGSGTKNQTVYADAETANDINFTAKAAWTATVTALPTKAEGGSSVEWLTLDRYSGQAGAFSLKMNLEPNYTGETRKAQIEIICGETTIRIVIEQKGTNKDGTQPEEESAKKPPLDANGNIQFPDPVFAAFMVENFDKDGDCGISPAEAAQITKIDCQKRDIISIHGIQYCTALTTLICNNNSKLPAINLSKIPALTTVECCDNAKLTTLRIANCPKLASIKCTGNTSLAECNFSKNAELIELNCSSTTLDVRGCTALTKLECSGTRLTTLNASGCTALIELMCSRSKLTSLDVRGCTALTYLDCHGNQLTALDVSGCTALTSLDCSENQLTTLDVSGCTELQRLECHGNQLTSLDVSKNTKLTDLFCYRNQLTALDVSNNTELTRLYCGYNQLTSLNVSGCTKLVLLDYSNNPLTTLVVNGHILFPDSKFAAYMVEHFDTNGDGGISPAEAAAITEIECPGMGIESVAGIEYCTKLIFLNCTENQLTTLDVSKNMELIALGCNENQLTALNISKNTK